MDDALLKSVGDEAVGVVSASFYSAAFGSESNKRFVAAMQKNYGVLPEAIPRGCISPVSAWKLPCRSSATKATTAKLWPRPCTKSRSPTPRVDRCVLRAAVAAFAAALCWHCDRCGGARCGSCDPGVHLREWRKARGHEGRLRSAAREAERGQEQRHSGNPRRKRHSNQQRTADRPRKGLRHRQVLRDHGRCDRRRKLQPAEGRARAEVPEVHNSRHGPRSV